MLWKLPLFGSIIVVCLALSGGCKSDSDSSKSESESKPLAATKPSIPIPPDSPFAKVKVGMGMKEVYDLIGEPTDTDSYVTGKSFNPFYYGGDTHRMTARYKGIGTITFSPKSRWGSGMRAIEIEYDPSESGYNK